MSSNFRNPPISLLEICRHPPVNQISRFCNAARNIDLEDLAAAYRRCCASAPRRHARRKSYFVGHTGVTSSGHNSGRREEHLAVALWNSAQRDGVLTLPGNRSLTLLDYQFPLKARRGDTGVGKVDLFGVFDNSKACVIELKIHSIGSGKSDTPLRAFLEALAYCAVVEANASEIASEASEDFGLTIVGDRPALMVLATEEYWTAYAAHESSGNWWPALRQLSDKLAVLLDLECHFVSLRNAEFSIGLIGQKPVLAGKVVLENLQTTMGHTTIQSRS